MASSSLRRDNERGTNTNMLLTNLISTSKAGEGTHPLSSSKGRKRDRAEQNNLGPSKRQRPSEPGENECDDLILSNRTPDDLVRLMKQDRIDGICKPAEVTSRRAEFAGVIASMDRHDFLKRLVDLGVLSLLDEWLQEAHRGKSSNTESPKETNKNATEDLVVLALLNALEKLPVDLVTLKACLVGKSVNNLRSHRNVEIQKKARRLVEIWKKQVDAEMKQSGDLKHNPHNNNNSRILLSSSSSSNLTSFEMSSPQPNTVSRHHPAFTNASSSSTCSSSIAISKSDSKPDSPFTSKAYSWIRSSTPDRAETSLGECSANNHKFIVRIPNPVRVNGGSIVDPPAPSRSSSNSSPNRPEEVKMGNSTVGITIGIDTDSSPTNDSFEDNEGRVESVAFDLACRSSTTASVCSDPSVTGINLPVSVATTTEILSDSEKSVVLEGIASSADDRQGLEHCSADAFVSSKDQSSSIFPCRPVQKGADDQSSKKSDERGELIDLHSQAEIDRLSEKEISTKEQQCADDVVGSVKGAAHHDDLSEGDSKTASTLEYQGSKTLSPVKDEKERERGSLEKQESSLKRDKQLARETETAGRVLEEVASEKLDSSSNPNQRLSTDENPLKKAQSSSRSTQHSPAFSERLDFDLNEGFTTDEALTMPITVRCSPINNCSSGLTTPIAIKGGSLLIIPPATPLQSKDELGWKGSAKTSAFRPAQPRRSTAKLSKPVFDFDLNIANEMITVEDSIDDASSSKPSDSCNKSHPRPILDLNFIDGCEEQPVSQGSDPACSLQKVKSTPLGIDLNDGPSSIDTAFDYPNRPWVSTADAFPPNSLQLKSNPNNTTTNNNNHCISSFPAVVSSSSSSFTGSPLFPPASNASNSSQFHPAYLLGVNAPVMEGTKWDSRPKLDLNSGPNFTATTDERLLIPVRPLTAPPLHFMNTAGEPSKKELDGVWNVQRQVFKPQQTWR